MSGRVLIVLGLIIFITGFVLGFVDRWRITSSPTGSDCAVALRVFSFLRSPVCSLKRYKRIERNGDGKRKHGRF